MTRLVTVTCVNEGGGRERTITWPRKSIISNCWAVLIDLEPDLSVTVEVARVTGCFGHVREQGTGVADVCAHGEANLFACFHRESLGRVAVGAGVLIASDVKARDILDRAIAVGAGPVADVFPVAGCSAILDKGREDVYVQAGSVSGQTVWSWRKVRGLTVSGGS